MSIVFVFFITLYQYYGPKKPANSSGKSIKAEAIKARVAGSILI
jgi:hypothetical protein